MFTLKLLSSGDQGNVTVLNRWIKESGGKFHVIIDDGGHRNSQIKTSFDVLFEKALLPGVYCFRNFLSHHE
jgi:hypothetical protein